jgi:hypothetical protein
LFSFFCLKNATNQGKQPDNLNQMKGHYTKILNKKPNLFFVLFQDIKISNCFFVHCSNCFAFSFEPPHTAEGNQKKQKKITYVLLHATLKPNIREKCRT